MICHFEQQKRIFARVARGPAPAARATIQLTSPPQSEYLALCTGTRFEDYGVSRGATE